MNPSFASVTFYVPASIDRGHIVFGLSVCQFVCPQKLLHWPNHFARILDLILQNLTLYDTILTLNDPEEEVYCENIVGKGGNVGKQCRIFSVLLMLSSANAMNLDV